MDRNDQMILSLNSEIKNDIQTQLTILNSMNENVNNIPNVVDYFYQETLSTFTST
jgi:hypothetical protein